MYTTDTRKISVIEEVLKVDNEDTLKALEAVLKSARTKILHKKTQSGISDFVGFLSKKEANTMRNVIAETSETIHPDDWK
ncbi:hypothetical protein [Niabella aquatica]